ncbi:MAG: MMPL family transporter [Candidatus Heimdallarchaeaceae archaeon]
MSFVGKYHKFLLKYKLLVVIAWLVILAFGIWLGPKFIRETELNFEPPPNSPSERAEEIFTTEFPERNNDSNLIIVIQALNENESVINQEVNISVQQLLKSLQDYQYKDDIQSVQDYFTLYALGYLDLANELVSSNKRSTIIIVEYLGISAERTRGLRDFVYEAIGELSLSPEEYYIGITGSSILILDIESGTMRDIARMDAIVIPLALIVLALVLQSFRLMIIPIVTMGISALTSFMIMYPIATSDFDVISFAPSVMMSCVIAMSIDYSLFLLTRYREEIFKEKDVSTSVRLMSEHAGHTITVSGLTLAVCFLGLVFFPMDLLSSIGLGTAIAVICTLIVNLTFTPAVLLTFSKFFSNFTLREKLIQKRKGGGKEGKHKTKEELLEIELDRQLRNIWYKISKLSTKYATAIILIIFIIAVPVSIQVFKLKHTVDTKQVFPRNADSVEAYNILLEDFHPGAIIPYYIIIQTDSENGVISQTCFSTAQQLIEELNSTMMLPYSSLYSIFTMPNGMPIPYTYAVQYLSPDSSLYDSKEGILYRIVFDRYTNSKNSSVLIEIQTPFDPYSSETFVKEMRDFLTDFQKNDTSGYSYYLAAGICSMVDSIDRVYQLFPTMIVITIGVVYILIALMFRSAFIPLRLLITIGLTLSWIYGLAVLVFEMGIFDWLFPVLIDIDAMYWITPVMAFSILVGLGLDYDVFLLSRISEYRRKGYTERSAIHKGVYRTGGIISAAGIIMAIAFSGLMMSTEMVLNQFGFILCFAVLVDTFIIRTILVPAIMSLAEKWNWWPGKMPKPTKDDYYVEDELL